MTWFGYESLVNTMYSIYIKTASVWWMENAIKFASCKEKSNRSEHLFADLEKVSRLELLSILHSTFRAEDWLLNALKVVYYGSKVLWSKNNS